VASHHRGRWKLWHGFHSEQARLSGSSRHVISGHADHALHESDPDLVIAAIREVVRSVRTGIPPAYPATKPDDGGSGGGS
jgi:hypothetical protein